jgi:hypothetical protein
MRHFHISDPNESVIEELKSQLAQSQKETGRWKERTQLEATQCLELGGKLHALRKYLTMIKRDTHDPHILAVSKAALDSGNA